MKHLGHLKRSQPDSGFDHLRDCDVCYRAKQQRSPFPVLHRRSSTLFKILHVDVWGPYREENVANTHYILTLVEDHSRTTWTYLLQSKDQEHGIIHQKSCVYSPQQNGIVERKHKHLLQVARALMFQSKLPSKFWPYSILHATWLINRLPTVILNWTTPYEILLNKPPTYSAIYPFGCLGYAANTTPSISKFNPRSHRCIFLGLAANHK